MDSLRIANINKLAGVPYKILAEVEGIAYQENSPTENAGKLFRREVDAALIPAYDFLVRGCYQSLDFGLGCRSRSDSMILYSQEPVSELDTVFVYSCSCSSMALLKLLLREEWGTSPKIVRRNRLETFDHLGPRQGALALHSLPGSLQGNFNVREDLATVWKRRTGMPFTFLIWAVHPGVLRSDQLTLLQSWFYRAVSLSAQLARESAWSYGCSENLSVEFVDGHRRYYLDSFLLGGLEEFIIRCQKQNWLSGVKYCSVKKNLFGEVLIKPRPGLALAGVR